jgi:CelD/BcsL family acetyltransferase involved in cellulose biosynthesis
MLRHLLPFRQAWLNATGDSSIDSVMIEHNGFACAAEEDPTLVPALVKWFADGGFAADEFLTPGVAPDGAVTQHKGLLLVEKRSTGYRAPLHAMGDGGLAPMLSRNARQQLRRSLRDYGGCLSLDRASGRDEALEYFTGLKDLHIRSWTRRGRRHAFGSPFFETFHRLLIETGIADGSVDLLRISSNEHVLGYLYNFRRNGVVSSYQSGFADETPGLRPGYVCHALAIARYAQEGMRYYDFLAGSNRLKRSFGLETYELCWSQYRKPTFGFVIDDLLRKAGRQIGNRTSRQS